MLGWLKEARAGLGRAAAGTRAAAGLDAKASKAGAVIALHTAGRPVWTPRTYQALARAGYMKNPIAYRAVRLVAEAAASVPWLLYEGAAELDDHPLLKLIAQPNPHQTGVDLLEAL